MLLEVGRKPMQGPATLEAKTFHIVLRFCFRGSSKINLVKGGNQSCPIAADVTMEINRAKALVTEDAQGMVDVLFRRWNG